MDSKKVENLESIDKLKAAIKSYSDFPKPGIIFYDIFSIFSNINLFRLTLNLIKAKIKDINIEAIAGLESRGFLFGPTLALEMKLPFVPIRKKNKLPGKKVSCSYTIEYGTDILEIQEESVQKNVNFLIIDDLIATGGSMDAAVKLIQTCGGNVALALVIIELIHLNGKSKLTTPLVSLIQI